VRVDEHTIEVAGSPVFYRSAEAPGPVPLYLHGVPTSSDDWVPFLERAGGVAPDLIGFGRSGKGGHLDYSIGGLAAFLEGFVDHLGLDRVELVVHDWGSGPGLIWAQRHPERVERLVVCNAVPLFSGYRWHRMARLWRRPVVGELVMGATTKATLGRGLRQGSATSDAWTAERLEQVWEQFDQGTQRAILRLYRSAGESELAAAGSELERLEMDSVVIWGERDPWLPVELADRYAARLHNATLERVPNAAHWPWLDQPDVIDRIASFLQAT
jgi:pimeloyl-ACP methyl ester carboxylesterase